MNGQLSSRGFTVVEVMATLAVAAILLVVAVPAYQNLARNNELSTGANKLVGDISFSRSEAVKRNVDVTLCPSDGSGCVDNDDYSQPWSATIVANPERVVFVDADNDNNFVSAGDLVLSRTSTAGVFAISAAVESLEFFANGLVGGAPMTFRLSDPAGEATDRCVVLSVTGRAKVVTEGETGCAN